ncbi:predicted protein [Naegleria gruberi]|uniref:Predicted protein n=1 Tax=Naegleria gruberi TaxID=5762 RepID=D2VFA8_NAEGR|nr:uncharacterized protein NAEGRDRAFT_67559 [Naegleria gruberi]EFC44427.1 predicted protein [Naegleria gruberi]|eukprot:XP_002677171.1 predicted protein [Naegleria gruberi strain NEG-M]
MSSNYQSESVSVGSTTSSRFMNDICSDPFIPYRKFTAEQQRGKVPSQRSQIALVACPPRHSLFCMGGVVEEHVVSGDLEVFELDLRTGVWQQHSVNNSAIRQAWGMKCVYRRADHAIYFFGGNVSNMGYQFLDIGVFKLDLNTFKWKTHLGDTGLTNWRQATGNLTGYPYPHERKVHYQSVFETVVPIGDCKRYAHAMELKSDQSGFVVFGGEGSLFEFDDFIEFDFRDLLWKDVEVLAGKKPSSRHVLCSAMVLNKFFIFGGRTSNDHYYASSSSLNLLEYFDFNCKTWFSVDCNYSFPDARFAAGLSSFQSYGKPKFISKTMKFNHNFESQYEYLILHGGRNDINRFKDTQIYNIEEEIWKNCKLVDDSLSMLDIQREEENEKSSLKRITLGKERKLKKKILTDDEIIYRGGNIGLCIGYNDINFKSNCLFYDYGDSMTTFSRPMISSYPTTLSKKFLSFGGKTGKTGYSDYDSSLLTFDLTHFDYQNDPSLLIDPTKSASTDAVFEELSMKLLKENNYSDYTLVSTDGDRFLCHKFMLSHIQYFRELFEKKLDTTHFTTLTLKCLLRYCYGIELTPNDVSLPYHEKDTPIFKDFIEIYSAVCSIGIQEMIDYLRKLLYISIDIRKGISLFKIIWDKLKLSNDAILKDLAILTANYLSFNVLPTINETREKHIDIFLSQKGFSEEEISFFKLCCTSQIDSYETKRVRLAREYMYTNFSMLMDSSLQYSQINTNATLSLTFEDKTWKITVPKALLCIRYEYFNNLFNNMVVDESNVIDISDVSMIFYLQDQAHPLISVAALVYFAYTNDVDFENVILCKSAFPTCDTTDINPSFEINQETITQYIIDIYSMADFIADISLKESLLQYVRRLVSSGAFSCDELEGAAKELQKVDFEVLAEIAEIFSDCVLEQRAIEMKVKKLEEEAAFKHSINHDEDDEEGDYEDDDYEDDE